MPKSGLIDGCLQLCYRARIWQRAESRPRE